MPNGLTTVANFFNDDNTMSRNTLSFALPETMRAYIEARVATGHYGNTSECIRDLVRKDQAEESKARLRALIEEGLASGTGRPLTQADEDELLAIARGEIEWSPRTCVPRRWLIARIQHATTVRSPARVLQKRW